MVIDSFNKKSWSVKKSLHVLIAVYMLWADLLQIRNAFFIPDFRQKKKKKKRVTRHSAAVETGAEMNCATIENHSRPEGKS